MKTTSKVAQSLRSKVQSAMQAASHLAAFKINYIDVNITAEPGEPELYKEKGCNGEELLRLLSEFEMNISHAAAKEKEACDMARAMIHMCGYFRGLAIPAQSRQACGRCSDLSNKSCKARSYLAVHGDAHAWEVQS